MKIKLTTILSVVLFIAFFMQWVGAFGFGISAFKIPTSLGDMGRMAGDMGGFAITASYLLYLIPILCIVFIVRDLKGGVRKQFLNEFGVAAVLAVVFLIVAIANDFAGYLGAGFYITLIVAAAGLFVKDKSQKFTMPAPAEPTAESKPEAKEEKDLEA